MVMARQIKVVLLAACMMVNVFAAISSAAEQKIKARVPSIT